MKVIVNVTKDWGIGYENKLLCHIPEDLQNFKYFTSNKIIVYGRNTLDTFPGRLALPGRTNILLTHNHKNVPEEAKKWCGAYSLIKKKNLKGEDILCTATRFNNLPVGKDRTSLVVLEDLDLLDKVVTMLGKTSNDVVVCGGASVYQQLLPKCDIAYVTVNDYTPKQVNFYFPNLDEMPEWEVISKGEEHKSVSGIGYQFKIYSNKKLMKL